ncbi:MAG: UbiA family prenyltransferase [Desulfarculaceae bacterium]|nr:UbiA family prenyltransferase [Desulfarculaceae bacterium]MCF8071977.1 UbiA family prenyltransferase [Desulfarculaceae bacterium]MCF8101494.1 UbiA family prenyltransferase [Desulfarculaceae bacterium]MCF8115044.1 UbiA family prenyltransferase [Desulfarculaceae bacterium]
MKRPLCVDLDGTLLLGDSLWYAVATLLHHAPFAFLRIAATIFKGKAHFKAALCQEALKYDIVFSYNNDVLHWLQEEKKSGRPLYLVTGADRRIAEIVTKQVAVFDGMMTSDGETNLTSGNKAKALATKFGASNYDYIGDSVKDMAACRQAQKAYLVRPTRSLLNKYQAQGIEAETPWGMAKSQLAQLIKTMRPHQWAKNLLLFVPFILAHNFETQVIFKAVFAFVAFCFLASGVYICNDLLDQESDRRHPHKKDRPIASGGLNPNLAFAAAIVLLAVSLFIGSLLNSIFFATIVLYLLANVAYSVALKKAKLVDVLILAGLFSLRIFAGGVATEVPISDWLIVFSIFFFLNLAFLKRFIEVNHMQADEKMPGRDYYGSDRLFLFIAGVSSGYLSVLVFLLYLTSAHAKELYKHPKLLILICPILIYWVSRMWLYAHRGLIKGDPVIFALKGKQGYLVGLLIMAIIFAAAWLP